MTGEYVGLWVSTHRVINEKYETLLIYDCAKNEHSSSHYTLTKPNQHQQIT